MPAVPMQFPLAQSFSLRRSSLVGGAVMYNFMKEVHPDGTYVQRRNGLTQTIDGTAGGAFVQGIAGIQEPTSGSFYAGIINGGAAARLWLNPGSFFALGGTTTTSDWYTCIPALSSGSYYALLSSRNNMWGLAATGPLAPTIIAAPPGSHTRGLAFLDGTAYVMSFADNLIHGSALQDMTTWPALNVIGASTSWGSGISVRRHLNYVLGFYRQGLQVYYNAGLAPPGSPLAPLPNASFLVGCICSTTIVSMADTTIFVGSTAAGNLSVYMLAGLSLSIISNTMVDTFLRDNISLFNTAPDAYPFVNAFSMTDKGHILYVLRVQGRFSFVWDSSTQEWHIWTSQLSGVEVPFIGRDSYSLVVAGDDGKQYVSQDTAYQDTTGPILGQILTPNMDFQSSYKKFLHKLSIIGDTIPSTMQVDYSDDDYQTYSNAFDLPLSKQRKMMNRGGSFYNRSFRFRYSDAFACRFQNFELLIEGGSA